MPANERRPTFQKFAWLWFDDYVKPNNKHSEQLAKKYVLTASLIPFFGHMSINQIRGHDIERYKAAQVREGFKNKTITNRLTILNKCLITAYEWLELEGAPPKIKWPKWSLPDIDYLSPDECELLLSHASGVVFEMVLTALRTGMRQGELRGLQWSSLDWLTRSVAVSHSRDDHRKVLVPPKMVGLDTYRSTSMCTPYFIGASERPVTCSWPEMVSHSTTIDYTWPSAGSANKRGSEGSAGIPSGTRSPLISRCAECPCRRSRNSWDMPL